MTPEPDQTPMQPDGSPSRTGRRDDHPDDGERRRLLDAAWTVLERSSFESLKMQQVARAAGTSMRAVYRQFDGKADLLAALRADELRQGVAWLRQAMSSGTPTDRVRAWLEVAVGMRYRPRASTRVRLFSLAEPDLADRSGLPAPDVDYALPLIEAIAAGKASGDFPTADPELDGRLISALCTRLSQRPVIGMPDDREAATRIVTSFVLRALTNRDGA